MDDAAFDTNAFSTSAWEFFSVAAAAGHVLGKILLKVLPKILDKTL